MRNRPLLAILALLVGVLPAQSEAEAPSLGDLKLSQLEQRLEEIDAELGRLATISLRSGIGSIGHRSRNHTSNDHVEWVEIEFDKEYQLDEIVLVPTLWRDSEKGFQADGFPDKFRIIVGKSNDKTGTVLGEYGSTPDSFQSIAPYTIAGQGVHASWIRVEATHLSQRAFDKRHVFQLAEVFIFSGEKNIALRQPVKVSSTHPEPDGSAWNPRFLVDGHTPYLMNAAQGLQSLAYISRHGQSPVLTFDLEAEVTLSRLHLHALEQSDTVPQAARFFRCRGTA
ncbi:MAG: hypothetical protein H7A51_08285 [Akkermansiaceae bacterium]|nr:hypothetical protein [Akkermansiaceae bacterium]